MKFCDECPFFAVEPPIRAGGIWTAHCCDPHKPVPGARRVIGTAPGNTETGPIRVQTPVWCRRNT